MTLILILILWTLAMSATFVVILRSLSRRRKNPFTGIFCLSSEGKTYLDKNDLTPSPEAKESLQ